MSKTNKSRNMSKSARKYPTKWAYGIPRGSISDRRTSLILRLPDDKKKPKYFNYPIGNYDSKEECMEDVEKQKVIISRQFGQTRNEVRFINKDTIEVKLTKGKTFKTDAKNLKLVNKYPLQARKKREKGNNRYYVLAQDKKKQFQFTKLITKYKIVEYVNGNTLDLRNINMKEFGLDVVVVNKISDDMESNFIEDMSRYYFINSEKLPNNKWILGTIEGTIFFRNEDQDKILTMRTKNYSGNTQSKTFKVEDHGSIKKTRLNAQNFMINCAYYYQTVKNKIRIDDDYIEVMLDEENIMKTDLIFLPLFVPSTDNLQAPIIVTSVLYGPNSTPYAKTYSRTTGNTINYHKFIMGSPMIDHINGDPLDNRLVNLRFTSYSHNNSNRRIKSNTQITGVTHGRNKTGEYYLARITNNHKPFVKFFYIKDHGPKTKEYAERYRKDVMEINCECNDIHDLPFDKKDEATVKNSIKRTKDYLEDMVKRIVFHPNMYMYGIKEISAKYKKIMHSYYLKLQSERFVRLETRISALQKLLKRIQYLKSIKIIEV